MTNDHEKEILKYQIALVTGASSGIGEAIAKAMAAGIGRGRLYNRNYNLR